MEENRAAILLAVLIIVGTAFTQCYAAPSDSQQPGEQYMYDAARGAKMTIQETSDVTRILFQIWKTT